MTKALLALLLFASPCFAQTQMLILNHANEIMAYNDSAAAADALYDSVAYCIAGLTVAEVENRLRPMIRNKGTLIIHTIGHGSADGRLIGLGSRNEFLQMLDKVSEDTGQEIIWWQLSCHALAGLQQPKRITVISSSPAHAISNPGIQAQIMKNLFNSLSQVDTNKDGEITVQELRDYFNSIDSLRRGDLIYSPKSDKKILKIN